MFIARNLNFPLQKFIIIFFKFYYYYYLLLSASLYFSKRGAYCDRLCRDVVGRWLVVTRVHCGQPVHPRTIVTMETLPQEFNGTTFDPLG